MSAGVLASPLSICYHNNNVLPLECLEEICAQIVGDYFAALVVNPRRVPPIDPVLSMLGLCRSFRAVMKHVLELIWGDTFYASGTK